MKKLLLLAVLFSILSSSAQFCLPQGASVIDGLYIPTHSQQRIIPYPPLREADVMWNKRVWRVMDLREKINHPLYFPIDPIPSRTSFMQMIMDRLTCDAAEYQLTAYDVLDDEFSVRLTRQEVLEKSFTQEEIAFENDMGEIENQVVKNDFDFGAIKRIRLKEEWFFDNQMSVLNVRIIGLCPVLEAFDEMGEYKGEKPLVWLYFPELRVPMSTTKMFNPKNIASTITYDHLFMKRKFSSYISKESNVYDRSFASYKQDIDILLESKRVEFEIFQLEQDLWEY